MARPLDFCVIGAHKGGSTTVFHALRKHRDIYIPPGKEVPFFSDDEKYDLGYEWYLNNYFPGYETDARLLGTVTPQYLSAPDVPARLHAVCPDCRLIAVLRDPLRRAMSHFSMEVRLGHEQREIETAFQEELIGQADPWYLDRGLYGKHLKTWLQWYPLDRILVLFTDELSARPEAVAGRICSFLGIDTLNAQGFGERHHVGGTKARLPWLKPLIYHPVTQKAKYALPRRLRSGMAYHAINWNVRKGETRHAISATIHSEISHIYDEDASLLERTFGLSVPWKNGTGTHRQ